MTKKYLIPLAVIVLETIILFYLYPIFIDLATSIGEQKYLDNLFTLPFWEVLFICFLFSCFSYYCNQKISKTIKASRTLKLVIFLLDIVLVLLSFIIMAFYLSYNGSGLPLDRKLVNLPLIVLMVCIKQVLILVLTNNFIPKANAGK